MKSIYLERCQSITKLPDLCAPNLEKLEICFCDNLIEIHDSIGLLDKLESLELLYCKKLQILPSTLKLNKCFWLCGCSRVEKFPNIHPEMKYLEECLVVDDTNIREWPSSLRYLTESITQLRIQEIRKVGIQLMKEECENLENLKDINNLFGISIDLDFCMKNDFFPALRYITILDSNIVSIPESISKLSRLEHIYIRDCKELREIQSIFRLPRLKGIYIRKCKELREIQNPRLPQSIRRVIIKKCPSLLPQASSRLLNQVRSLSLIIK